jgi:hypothetical protein
VQGTSVSVSKRFITRSIPYFNPAFTASGNYVLRPGKPLVLRYRLAIRAGTIDRQGLETAWKAFAESNGPRDAGARSSSPGAARD